MWWVSPLSLSAPRTWNKPSISVSSFGFGLPLKRDLYWTPSPRSLFLPPLLLPLSLFYFFSISRFLLTLLWQSAQPRGQRTEGLACVCLLWRRKQGKRGVRGNMVKMENLRWGASEKLCTRYKKWQFLCKHINMEIFSGGSQNSMRPLFNKCVHIFSNFIITLNNIGEKSLSLGLRMLRSDLINFSTKVLDAYCKGFLLV